MNLYSATQGVYPLKAKFDATYNIMLLRKYNFELLMAYTKPPKFEEKSLFSNFYKNWASYTGRVPLSPTRTTRKSGCKIIFLDGS